MNLGLLVEAEALLTRLGVLAEQCRAARPASNALREACSALHEQLAARVAATGRAVTLHTDGEVWFLDGQRLPFDAQAHVRVQRATAWMRSLGANEFRFTPPIPAGAVATFAEELALSLEEGSPRPTLADQRPGRIMLRARSALRVRADVEMSAAEASASDLERVSVWCEEALPVAASLTPDAVVVRRALWRVQARASRDPSTVFAVSLRSDPSDSLARHIARSAVLATAFMTGLGLNPMRTVEGVLCALDVSLGLGGLPGSWWRAQPSVVSEALLARHRLGEAGRTLAGAMCAQDLARLMAADVGEVPRSVPLATQVFAAAAWLDRARNGLHADVPRCTPLQARAALEVWARRRGAFAPGLATALGALLGAVPPGSIVRAGGHAGVLRGANEVAAVDGEGRVSLFTATAVSAACSEPAGVPQGYFACPPSPAQG